MKVDVYYNSHKKNLSIRSRETETYGKVLLHRNNVVIKNPTFISRRYGYQKYLDTGVKNHHAFVRGELSNRNIQDNLNWCRVFYNPELYGDKFVRKDGDKLIPVHSANLVKILGKYIFANFNSQQNIPKIIKKNKLKKEYFGKINKTLTIIGV